jgi:hypothetical protein
VTTLSWRKKWSTIISYRVQIDDQSGQTARSTAIWSSPNPPFKWKERHDSIGHLATTGRDWDALPPSSDTASFLDLPSYNDLMSSPTSPSSGWKRHTRRRQMPPAVGPAMPASNNIVATCQCCPCKSSSE